MKYSRFIPIKLFVILFIGLLASPLFINSERVFINSERTQSYSYGNVLCSLDNSSFFSYESSSISQIPTQNEKQLKYQTTNTTAPSNSYNPFKPTDIFLITLAEKNNFIIFYKQSFSNNPSVSNLTGRSPPLSLS